MFSVWTFIAAGCAGATMHWYKRYYLGQTRDSFITYLWTNRGHTLLTYSAVFAGTIQMFEVTPPELSAWGLAIAFKGGFMADSLLNLGSNPVTAPPEAEKAKPSPVEVKEDKKQETKTLQELFEDDQTY